MRSSAITIKVPSVPPGLGDKPNGTVTKESLKLSVLPPTALKESGNGIAQADHSPGGSLKSRGEDEIPVLSPISERDEDDEGDSQVITLRLNDEPSSALSPIDYSLDIYVRVVLFIHHSDAR
jgi:hypothetical protein